MDLRLFMNYLFRIMNVRKVFLCQIEEMVRGLFLFFWIAVMCIPSHAQTDKTITIRIRMLDSKTGHPITESAFQVWINHAVGTNRKFIEQNKDGVGEMTMPPDASVIAIHAQDKDGWFYVNCDSVRDRGPYQDHWYAISEILKSGVVARNRCSKQKTVAQPGDLVLFVRPQHWWEKMRE